jgi:hypothetical protein
MSDKTDVIKRVCKALSDGDKDGAATTLRTEYPFEAPTFAGRKYKEIEATRIFTRDGFIDRYSGQRLIFQPALRLLSMILPAEFPYHPNWKMDQTHIAFWELTPTVDHIVPVARGGADDETNWVTTSMLRNSAKSNWTLDDLNWELFPPGDITKWDGLCDWFLGIVGPEHLKNGLIRRWHKALLHVRA